MFIENAVGPTVEQISNLLPKPDWRLRADPPQCGCSPALRHAYRGPAARRLRVRNSPCLPRRSRRYAAACERRALDPRRDTKALQYVRHVAKGTPFATPLPGREWQKGVESAPSGFDMRRAIWTKQRQKPGKLSPKNARLNAKVAETANKTAIQVFAARRRRPSGSVRSHSQCGR